MQQQILYLHGTGVNDVQQHCKYNFSFIFVISFFLMKLLILITAVNYDWRKSYHAF